MSDQRFRGVERLKSKADFQAVYDRRRSMADERIILYGRINGLEWSRLGLSVSRKYGPAVKRVRAKRLYREMFRLTKADMPTGIDWIVIPRSPTEPTLSDLLTTFHTLGRALAKRLVREQPS